MLSLAKQEQGSGCWAFWRTGALPAGGAGLWTGNVINLLRLLRGDLCGLDLSNLTDCSLDRSGP